MRYVFGDYTLDTLPYELRRAGAPIALRPKVFHLLTYLLVHRDRIVPRQELCDHLWPKQFVSDATLDACLAEARQAVGDSGHTQRVIQTRHGYGYRFVATVEVHDDSPGEGPELSLHRSSLVVGEDSGGGTWRQLSTPTRSLPQRGGGHRGAAPDPSCPGGGAKSGDSLGL